MTPSPCVSACSRLNSSSAWRLGLLALAASLLSACASGPRFASAEAPSEGHAALYIYREPGIFGVAMQPAIQVDGRLIGHLPAGGYLRAEVPVSVSPRRVFVGGQGCLPLGPLVSAPGAFEISAGSTAYVALDIQVGSQAMGDRYVWNNTCRLQLAEPTAALAALPRLHRAH